MSQRQSWSSPALQNHGSAASITQNAIDFQKEIGTGDSILLVINGVSATIVSPDGGSLINTTVTK